MTIDAAEIEKIAHLARLSIDNSQIDSYIGRIFKLIEHIKMINTDNLEPMIHPLDAIQCLRKDIVTEENNREQLQSCAPAVKDGLFLVPQVIE